MNRIGELRGVARPSPALRRRLGIINAVGAHALPHSVEGIINNSIAVDALARLLTEAIEKNQRTDGRVDMKDVAAHVLAEMRASQ